jgi:MFS family permease
MISWFYSIRHDLTKAPGEDLMRLYWAGIFRKISISILAIFSPVYIYLSFLDFSYSQRASIVAVLVYWLIVFVFKQFFLIASENLSQKIGFKATIGVSLIPLLLYFPCVIFAKQNLLLFLPAAIFWGGHAGPFWWGYHGYFVKSADSKKFGESIGKYGFLETAAAILAPLVGVFVVSTFGFTVTFIVAAAFMVAGYIALGRDHDKKQRRDVKLDDILKLIFHHKRYSISYFGSGGETVLLGVVWPLYLYLFFGNFSDLGIVISASLFVSAVFGVLVGAWIDKQGERKTIIYGTPLISLSWVLRAIFSSIGAFIFADSSWNFGQKMVSLPLNALTYRKAVDGGTARAILFRELSLGIGAVSSLLIYSLWVMIGGSMASGFVIAIILSFLPMVCLGTKREKDTKLQRDRVAKG